MIWDVIIIGGGVAGLAAASELENVKGLVLEKENHCGNKLLLSGAGQCNITHGGEIKDFKDKFGGNWKFVRNILNDFTNEDMIDRFKIPMVTLENNKVFPKSLRAMDVLDELLESIKGNDIKINTGESVVKIELRDELVYIKSNKNEYLCKNIIIATGGITYRKTGSTGDGYRFAKMLDVEVEKPRFALGPIYLNNHKLKELSGVSFKDASISHYRDNKKVSDYKADLLITHFGYSGPVILNNSRYMNPFDVLKINFTEYKTKENLEKDFLELLKIDNNKTVKNILSSNILRKRLTDAIFMILDLDENIKASELKKQDRKNIIKNIFEFEVEITEVGREHISMVTAGGIKLNEINKKTMALKNHSNIYFIGECIDVDGDTGGYNIQFAFSSGIVTARNVMKNLSL